ncbi:multidrug transporter subunit MdtL [Shewanella sp. UCD-FRSSP16_17]|uniref:MdtL family multidrug efflux MFS transporter n=1 Tax=unclassified Shewanella TaxID=196818 RepID=UPI0007EE9B93|nr:MULTISPECIES: MdtL family multidrug efflux MFS transporter [unclassified Shewanella]MBQ4889284.1 MdtL family multidrug efflux MFS transporter [Shewanella sp. MMG014]OBT08042.1 multidrug transporter subunit MdtL [Shewanella sp. UCD-FRSSP16_17]
MFRFLLCSFSFVLLYPTAIDLYLVGLPQIAADLSATESQLHTAFSIYLGGMASTMLVAGKIADQIGRKPVAMVGGLIFIIASLLAGNTEQINAFLVARFFQGVGAGACYVAAFAILRDALNDDVRAKVLSMLNGIICIIPVIAPVVGHMIMIYSPWRTLFTVMAAIGLIVLIMATFVLRETLDKSSVSTAQGNTSESFLNGYFIKRLLITSLGITIILSYVNVSPMVIMGMLECDRETYASIMAFTALTSMVASFVTPLALNYFKQKTLMVFGQLLLLGSALGLVCCYQLNLEASYYIASFAMLCIAFSLGFGVTMSQALAPFSKRAAVASSLLCVSHVTFSAAYIWLMGMLNVSALNILIFILILGSSISMFLLLLEKANTTATHNEKSSVSS